MRNKCPYSGECQLENCLPVETCFIKQLIEERDEAEGYHNSIMKRADERLSDLEKIISIAKVWGLEGFSVIFDLAMENIRYVVGYPRKFQPEDLDTKIGELMKVLLRRP